MVVAIYTLEIKFEDTSQEVLTEQLRQLKELHDDNFLLKLEMQALEETPDWLYDLMYIYGHALRVICYDVSPIQSSGIIVNSKAAIKAMANPPLAMSKEDFMREVWPHHGE